MKTPQLCPLEGVACCRDVAEYHAPVAANRVGELHPGDILETCANTADLASAVGFQPRTSITDGIGCFVDWYRAYRGVLGS